MSLLKTVYEATPYPNWPEAMIKEINALNTNGNWDLGALTCTEESY